MGGSKRDDWWREAYEQFLAEEGREEERHREVERAIALNHLTPADHAAALIRLDPDGLYDALEDALCRANVDPASPQVDALRAARDRLVSLCGPRARSLDQRRADLVCLVEQQRSPERKTARELVEELRQLATAALESHDEKVILEAWEEALRHGNKPIRTAARVSVALDMFGDRHSYAPGKKPSNRFTSKEIDPAENAFRSALERLRRR